MADDLFTREVEWLLRFRRERGDLYKLAIKARRFVQEVASVQLERDIRRWVSPEAERLWNELDRMVDFLGVSEGKYLEGPIVPKAGLLRDVARVDTLKAWRAEQVASEPAERRTVIPRPARDEYHNRGGKK
jgi:hypothetical protein